MLQNLFLIILTSIFGICLKPYSPKPQQMRMKGTSALTGGGAP